MRRRGPAALVITCIAGAFALALAAEPEEAPPRDAAPKGSAPPDVAPRASGPRDADTPPVLQRFNSSVTFYASFDRLPPDADLSAGDGKANVPATPHELRQGLFDKALLCGQTPVGYQAAGNIDLARPGALAVWVSPQDWKRQGETPYLFFVLLHGAGRSMMMGRMGGTANHEILYAHAQVGEHTVSVLSGHTRDWESGGWHLLVLNWRAEAVEFSVDGGELQRGGAPWFAGATGEGGGLNLGNEGTPNQQYLADELTVFDRPLSHEEIRWLWERGAARK